MNACAEPDRVRLDFVMFVVASEPEPAETVPSAHVICPTAIVRTVVSTVPGALVSAVDVMVADQAAPVPRASTTVHADDGVRLRLVLLPVKAVLASVNGTVLRNR